MTLSEINLLVFLLYIKSRADHADRYIQNSTNNNIIEKPKKKGSWREEMSTRNLFSKGTPSSSSSSNPSAQARQAPEEKPTNAQNVLFRGKDKNTTTTSTNSSSTVVGNSSTTNSKDMFYNREKDVSSGRSGKDWSSSAKIHNIERPSPQDVFQRK